ncbi:putative RNA-binding protein, snRNP like protein [Bernardetia litoralis DSM 6794]|uniref:Putative RNA-binding protein, snRNP like protein n=1 Tax=Bernardetia litoralis (strain ATCC 23117 / DSM 6794 / NBRC 15988 / NCIMB 1366 / Fx l1 / Sio-4) TaxID=880071 RepID=I4AGS2_BERLS|nr:NFACT RNA binding domain-containing protein [Bernardetia litoralis]AFM03157.1 putative RNA-binding protein, snRNP like protein [Bernardetia litoralis DSM 6794]
MQNNYYFIRSLSNELSKQIIGFEIATIFSQNKDELLIGLIDNDNPETEFWIRATFTPELTTLSFPQTFARAKRNSIDLFDSIIGKKITSIRQFNNERAFGIEIEGDNDNTNFTLLFKLFGNRSNIILFSDTEIEAIFQHKLQADWEIIYDDLDRSLEQEKEDFLENGIKKIFPTFGKDISKYLNKKVENTEDKELYWSETEKLITYFDEIEELNFYIFLKKDGVKLSILNPNEIFEESDKIEILHKTNNIIEACNLFYLEFSKRYYLGKEKNAALKAIEKRHRQTQNYIDKTLKKIEKVENTMRYEEFGHILMANLHAVEPRSKSVELFDFYTNEQITIPLKDNLTAQKNAELFYRKGKNQKLEINNLYQNLDKKEEQLRLFESQLEEINNFESLKIMRKFLKENKIKVTNLQENEPDELPFKVFEYQDFQILVGKNSKNNDLLTQKFAYKEDLWLHARGVAGSHVVIKYRAGKPFPKSVIEKAASLAAYYSKSKTDSLCAVIVTPKKYVRKPKGAVLGAVVVEREDVVMVEPKEFG